MAESPVGVVVMAYGTPASPADIGAYYTHIRRGSAPSTEQLAALTARYEAIGGISPLAARTEAQRAGLESALGAGFRVVLGQRHAAPFIEDAVSELAASGVTEIVGLVLAPHWSRSSVGEYDRRLQAAAGEHGVTATTIPSWHLEPTYIEFLAAAMSDALRTMPEHTTVLFTAHSLPERALVDDPYPDQLLASAAAAAAAAGLAEDRWSLAWQSAGRTEDPWRGPDILDVLRDLASVGVVDGVLVCPQGFVSDHLEVVYDLDIEASKVAADLGLDFARTRVLNDDPTVLRALADRVREAAR